MFGQYGVGFGQGSGILSGTHQFIDVGGVAGDGGRNTQQAQQAG